MMLQEIKQNDHPCLFTRYEDLTSNPNEVMDMVFKFVLGTESLEGTEISNRIRKLFEEDPKISAYKPRSAGIGKGLMNISPEQMKYAMGEVEELLFYFGYAQTSDKIKDELVKYEDSKFKN